jgi:Flp pilus assembly protein TadG
MQDQRRGQYVKKLTATSWLKDDSGQALVEMALVLSMLLFLLTGIVEFGRVLSAQLVVSHASREGARIGVVGAADEFIIQRVMDAAGTLDTEKVVITVSPSPGERLRGSQLTVRVQYPVDIVMPFMDKILSDPHWVSGVTTISVD